MGQLYNSREISPTRRLDVWHSVVKEHFGHLDFLNDAGTRNSFEAELKLKSAGPAEVFEVVTGAHSMRRLPQDSKKQILHFILLTEGRLDFNHSADSNFLLPGDFLILDSSLDFELSFPGQMRQFVINVPLSGHTRHLLHLMRFAGQAVRGQTGVGAIASKFMLGFAQQADLTGEAQAERLFSHLMDVVNMSLLSAFDDISSLESSHQSLRYYRIRLYIEDKLHDPTLTPLKIAEENGISRRYLNKLFNSQGHSVTRFMWDRRLERCRKDLEDPFLAHRSLTEICYNWGFNSSSHFSRTYKQKFGLSPSESRKLAKLKAPKSISEMGASNQQE